MFGWPKQIYLGTYLGVRFVTSCVMKYRVRLTAERMCRKIDRVTGYVVNHVRNENCVELFAS